MLEHQQGLDETGQAGRHVEMADVALEGPEGAVTGAVRVLAVCRPRSFQLDGVALEGPRAVGLQVADGVRADARVVQGTAYGVLLASRAGSRVRLLAGTVVAHTPAADDAVDGVSVRERTGQPFEYDGQDTGASDGSVRGRVEGPQIPGPGEDRSLDVVVAEDLWDVEGAAPTRAMSQSPSSRELAASCTATSELEQAVCTLTAGPVRPSR